ncbi:MAG: 50S ribosomal protein L25 [Planctomycetes bacterium]|nr:50S ribosomal protein L25 [Planctomycetota bacterium]
MKIVFERRGDIGSRPAGRVRRTGRLPGVAYGKHLGATPISIDHREFVAVLRSGEHTVEGVLDGKEEIYLIQDVQTDPLGDKVVHVDLRQVRRDEKIKVRVPIETFGTPKAALHGGILDRVMVDLEVECLPHQIPEKFVVSIAEMQIGDVIRVGALALPEGVRVLADAELPLLALHVAHVEEEAPVPVEGEEPTMPKRIGEEEEGEGEESPGPAHGK